MLAEGRAAKALPYACYLAESYPHHAKGLYWRARLLQRREECESACKGQEAFAALYLARIYRHIGDYDAA